MRDQKFKNKALTDIVYVTGFKMSDPNVQCLNSCLKKALKNANDLPFSTENRINLRQNTAITENLVTLRIKSPIKLGEFNFKMPQTFKGC